MGRLSSRNPDTDQKWLARGTGRRRAALTGGVALVAAATVFGGVAFSSSAHAKMLDREQVIGNSKAEVETWGKGWAACRGSYPATRSINLTWGGEQYGPWGKGRPNQWAAWWECYDTPTHPAP